MKTTLVAVLTYALTFTASARVANIEFRAIDTTIETQLCVAAAKGGIAQAKQTAFTLGVNFNSAKRHTICNEQTLVRFATKFNKAQQQPKKNVVYKFVAADDAKASQICKDAVLYGLKAAAQSHNIEEVYCNGMLINRFVRKHRI